MMATSSIGQKHGEASCKKVKLNAPDDLHNLNIGINGLN
jgi:hypothetical protein